MAAGTVSDRGGPRPATVSGYSQLVAMGNGGTVDDRKHRTDEELRDGVDCPPHVGDG